MKTYIKIWGSNTEAIVQKLAKLAVESDQICVWDHNLKEMGFSYPLPTDSPIITGQVSEYFGIDAGAFDERCEKIVAKSGPDLEGYDLYYEWLTPPSDEHLISLKKKIDEILKPYSNKYDVVNK